MEAWDMYHSIPEQDIAQSLKKTASTVQTAMLDYAKSYTWPSERLEQATLYTLGNLGKCFRPWLVLETAKLFDVPMNQALPVALAIECIHTYSLVHDDLPSMDNSPLRRGRATVHMIYDEATAILTGDALQALAFGCLAEANSIPADLKCALIADLARAAGQAGMVGGQCLDMFPNHSDGQFLETMQDLKTGALIRFSCRVGGVLAREQPTIIQALDKYGQYLGLLFQITDDLLDVCGHIADTGKPNGQDAQKLTWISILGEKGTREKLQEIKGLAATCLSVLDYPPILMNMIEYVCIRPT
jgi:farnesyl diphosphate synthase